MNISPADLEAQCKRALISWPFIPGIEARYGLPAWLLLAVGSRETNLTNEVGDGGHGHGVWQLDDRSHSIPPSLDADVIGQAYAAARMLHDLLATAGNLDAALDMYNSGRPADAATTGGDYGPDVVSRLAYLQARFPATPPPTTEDDMLSCRDPKNGNVLLADVAGEVFALDSHGAPAAIGYLGGLTAHPDWHAGGALANGPTVAIFTVDDGRPGVSGYGILTRDTAGAFHAYIFPSDGSLAR